MMDMIGTKEGWIVVSQVLAKCYSVVVVGIAGKEGREVRKGKM